MKALLLEYSLGIALVVLVFCWFATDAIESARAEPQCVPDLGVIMGTVEDIQRIRVELEQLNAQIKLMREEAKKRK